jgi:hypothetical protein
MEKAIYLILRRIYLNNGPVTWYQLARMLKSRGLHEYTDGLNITLKKLENEGLILQKYNDGKPMLLSLTEKGNSELERLKLIYDKEE